MFGHQNNVNDNGQGNDAVQHGSNAPADGTVGSLEPATVAPTASSSHLVDDTSISSYVVSDLPETPVHTTPPASPPVIPPPADPSGAPQTTPPPIELPPAPAAPTPPPASSPAVTSTIALESGDLLSLKQSALHELSPLLGQLDQTPEERFRTMMMMIQASDDHTMLQSAYEAAKSIHDEKARAQALLDIVNEINYFTQATADTAI
jgi:hypothetical protein